MMLMKRWHSVDVFDLTQVKGKIINSVRTYVSDYHDHCQQTYYGLLMTTPNKPLSCAANKLLLLAR